MSPPSRTSRILLLSGAAIIVCSGYFLLRAWIGHGEPTPTPMSESTQTLSETEKLQTLQALSASASTTASPQQKANVLKALQKVSVGQDQDADLSDREKSDLLQALRAPN